MRTVFSVMLSMVRSFIGGGFTEEGSMLEDGVKLQSPKIYEEYYVYRREEESTRS